MDENGNIQAIRSGTTTIIVKAYENDVQNQITITVYSPITEIMLDQSEIYMQVDDTFKINAIVEPDDVNNKTLKYMSTNTEVATVDKNGIITAQREGLAIIMIISDENPNIVAECKVGVVRKLEDSEIHFDSSLTVNSLEISGIDYNSNTVADLKSKIITDFKINILNYNNEYLNDNDIIGTGCKIQVIENEEVIRQYQVIVYGDANGDGKINSVDLLVIQRHILEIEPLNSIFRKSSNINKNGKKPSSIDLLLIQRHILELQEIEQGGK